MRPPVSQDGPAAGPTLTGTGRTEPPPSCMCSPRQSRLRETRVARSLIINGAYGSVVAFAIDPCQDSTAYAAHERRGRRRFSGGPVVMGGGQTSATTGPCVVV